MLVLGSRFGGSSLVLRSLKLRDALQQTTDNPTVFKIRLPLLVELRTQIRDLICKHLDKRTTPVILGILSRLGSAAIQPY